MHPSPHAPGPAPAPAAPGIRLGQASFLAGLVAGIVYVPGRMLFALVLTPHGASAPLSRIAALLLGPDVLPPEPPTFVVITIALLIHFGLAIFAASLTSIP